MSFCFFVEDLGDLFVTDLGSYYRDFSPSTFLNFLVRVLLVPILDMDARCKQIIYLI
jgi:hypothetical protein